MEKKLVLFGTNFPSCERTICPIRGTALNRLLQEVLFDFPLECIEIIVEYAENFFDCRAMDEKSLMPEWMRLLP